MQARRSRAQLGAISIKKQISAVGAKLFDIYDADLLIHFLIPKLRTATPRLHGAIIVTRLCRYAI